MANEKLIRAIDVAEANSISSEDESDYDGQDPVGIGCRASGRREILAAEAEPAAEAEEEPGFSLRVAAGGS